MLVSLEFSTRCIHDQPTWSSFSDCSFQHISIIFTCSSLVPDHNPNSNLIPTASFCSTGCQCLNGYYIRLLLPLSTVSVALAQHTSSSSARRLLTSLVGHTSVLLNAATCWFLAPELSSADGVFQLLHRPSGTLFRHTCVRH